MALHGARGEGDFTAAVEALINHCREHGEPPCFFLPDDEYVREIGEAFPGMFDHSRQDSIDTSIRRKAYKAIRESSTQKEPYQPLHEGIRRLLAVLNPSDRKTSAKRSNMKTAGGATTAHPKAT